MSAQVLPFTGLTKLDMPAEKVLDGAMRASLESAVVVGFTQDGDMHFASSIASSAETIFLLQRAIYQLNRMMDDLLEGK